MITPELSNYVSQARASGQTDDQISRTLTQQGWQTADINEALGISVAPASATGKPFPKAVIVVVVLLLLLLMGSWFFSFSKSVINKQLQQSGTQDNNNPGNSLGFLGGKDRTCGNMDVRESREHSASDLNDSLKYFPSDFKLSNDTRHVATVGTEPFKFENQTMYGLFYFCTKQSKEEFRNFINTNNPDWFAKNQGLFLIPTKDIGNESHALILSTVDAGDGYTLIKIIHTSGTLKK